MQTLEGGPAFVHAGPFANIAHGNSSVVADRVALKLVDAVCTEAGFGADMGFQKFVDIKCRLSGLRPERRGHRGDHPRAEDARRRRRRVGGKPPDPRLLLEDPDGVRRGCANLAQHIAIVSRVRRAGRRGHQRLSATDEPWELDVIREEALEAGARDAVVSRHFAEGGAGRGGPGARRLGGRAGWRSGLPLPARDDATLRRADRVDRHPHLRRGRDRPVRGGGQGASRPIERLGYGDLPICMAKTQSSLSHDPALKGRPTGFRVPIRDARLFAGAGFVTAYCGDMRTMPGLPSIPTARAWTSTPTGASSASSDRSDGVRHQEQAQRDRPRRAPRPGG